MSNSVYERLKALIQDLGFNFTDGGITKAEIMAYTAGIELVNNILDKSIKSLMLDSDDRKGLAHYCKMLSVNDENYNLQELKKHIRTRLGERYSFSTAEEFKNAFSELGSGSYEISNGKIIISGIGLGGIEKIGEFIKGYVPFCTNVLYTGSGMTFDEWDKVSKCWDEYDSMSLPFNIIDKLGGDSF